MSVNAHPIDDDPRNIFVRWLQPVRPDGVLMHYVIAKGTIAALHHVVPDFTGSQHLHTLHKIRKLEICYMGR